jgi:flagellar assembly protein FliH
MSSNVWQPRVLPRTSNITGPRIARIIGGAAEAEAKPIAWREIGAKAGGGAAKSAEVPADVTAQMDLLRRQCEQRVREAHVAGVREAEASARTRAAAEVQGTIEKLAHSIVELTQLRAKLRKQAEGDTVKLSLAIAKRVVRREVAVDPDAMRGLVIAAIEKLHAQEIYRVRASAAQAPAIAAILKQVAEHSKIEVIPDGSLAPGGIVFETNHGNLDASVDSQLQEIERGLTDHLRKQS